MKFSDVILVISVITLVIFTQGFAHGGQRQKAGSDLRHQQIQKEARSIRYSEEKIQWKMVLPWTEGDGFFEIAQHFADSVALASGRRLRIKVFQAGELVGGMDSFEAVSKGSAEIGHDWPGLWMDKNLNFLSFGSIPLGLDNEGYNIWMYERGGLQQMQALYERFNLVALPCGRGGQVGGSQLAKNLVEPSLHQPSLQCNVFINQEAYQNLPPDLRWIIDISAKETQLWSYVRQESLNMEQARQMSLQELNAAKEAKNPVSAGIARAVKYLEELKSSSSEARKALESQEQFKRDFALWREVRGGLAPWPLDQVIQGRQVQ